MCSLPFYYTILDVHMGVHKVVVFCSDNSGTVENLEFISIQVTSRHIAVVDGFTSLTLQVVCSFSLF